ncbi:MULTISPECIES: hypothetical protein [unclassified Streptomyces]|uniref:hypothetical protein n=1 Tax=unclassified Streptomyces TaxID=2593676 RepID=UPI0036F0AAAE
MDISTSNMEASFPEVGLLPDDRAAVRWIADRLYEAIAYLELDRERLRDLLTGAPAVARRPPLANPIRRGLQRTCRGDGCLVGDHLVECPHRRPPSPYNGDVVGDRRVVRPRLVGNGACRGRLPPQRRTTALPDNKPERQSPPLDSVVSARTLVAR